MKYVVPLAVLAVFLSGCSNVLADNDSVMDEAGYSTYSGLSQDPNPGAETSSKMINAAMKR